jgi:hypothetical protein
MPANIKTSGGDGVCYVVKVIEELAETVVDERLFGLVASAQPPLQVLCGHVRVLQTRDKATP